MAFLPSPLVDLVLLTVGFDAVHAAAANNCSCWWWWCFSHCCSPFLFFFFPSFWEFLLVGWQLFARDILLKRGSSWWSLCSLPHYLLPTIKTLIGFLRPHHFLWCCWFGMCVQIPHRICLEQVSHGPTSSAVGSPSLNDGKNLPISAELHVGDL